MKTRFGFVANSSSASFVLDKKDITPLQAVLIRHHADVAEWLEIDYWEYAWAIWETDQKIEGNTPMTNLRIEEFFDAIGVNLDCVQFERCG